ncbi:hypothetical protein D3C71_2180950 [compost metagenome]
MIEEVMYGIIPIAKIEKLNKAPPEKVFNKPNRSAPLSTCLNTSVLIFGTGINEPIR